MNPQAAEGGGAAVAPVESDIKQIDINLKSLADLKGGALNRIVAVELAKIGMDMGNRPECKTARVLSIKLAFIPADDMGEDVKFSFQTSVSLPPRKSPEIGLQNNTANGKMAAFERKN